MMKKEFKQKMLSKSIYKYFKINNKNNQNNYKRVIRTMKV